MSCLLISRIFNFNQVNYINFYFMVDAFCVLLKKTLLTTRLRKYYSTYYFSSLIVLTVVISLWSILNTFLCMVWNSNLGFSSIWIANYLASCVEEIFFSFGELVCTFWKSYVWTNFWALFFQLYFFYLVSSSRCLDYCCFVQSLEVR